MKDTQFKYSAFNARTKEYVADQIRWEGQDGKKSKSKNPAILWQPKLNGIPANHLEPYGIRNFEGNDIAVWVEGCHKADALQNIGINAFYTFGNNPIDEAFNPILEIESVYVWGDNDNVGNDKANKIVQTLQRLGHQDVKRIHWEEAPPSGDVRDFLKVGGDIKALLSEAVNVDPPVQSQGDRGKRRSIAVELTEMLLENLELWHDENLTAYATINRDSHFENVELESSDFKNYMEWVAFKVLNKSLNREARREVLGILSGTARFEGEKYQTWNRVGQHNGNVILDLCNKNWEVIEVTHEGWRLLKNSPIRFIRSSDSRPLQYPIGGGNLDTLLHDHINVHQHDIPIVRTWVVDSMFVGGAKVIMSLNGEHGTAKTTTALTIRSVIDPMLSDLEAPPNNEHDLIVAGKKSWIMAYDNLSNIRLWLSNALCRIATGTGLKVRRLYTDAEVFTIFLRRPIILTGINQLGERGDLLDRMIEIDLPIIDSTKRKTEAQYWQEFNAVSQQILGAILDGVSAVLRELPNLNTEEYDLPRMADFALRGIALEKGLYSDASNPPPYGTFLKSYMDNIKGSNESALDNNILGAPIATLMNDREDWQGTSKELLTALKDVIDIDTREHKQWRDMKPNQVGRMLKSIAPNLRKVGIDATQNHRTWTLQKLRN